MLKHLQFLKASAVEAALRGCNVHYITEQRNSHNRLSPEATGDFKELLKNFLLFF